MTAEPAKQLLCAVSSEDDPDGYAQRERCPRCVGRNDLLNQLVLPSSSLISRTLATTRLVLCASPQYLAHAGTRTHPDELPGHAVLAYSYLDSGDDWPFEGPEGPVTVRVRPTMHTNSGDTCRVGALLHQGIVLQPSFLVGPDIDAGRLVEVLPEYRSIEMGIHAVYPTRKHVSPKVRLLIDFLVDSFRIPRWLA